MKINSNWREIARTINGFAGVDGLNTGEGLGLLLVAMAPGPQAWEGSAVWKVGNSIIHVSAWDEGNCSLVELRSPPDEPADKDALRAWDKLQPLLEEIYELRNTAESIQIRDANEKKVIELSAKHEKIRYIAGMIGMSQSTVKRIRRKWGINHRKS